MKKNIVIKHCRLSTVPASLPQGAAFELDHCHRVPV